MGLQNNDTFSPIVLKGIASVFILAVWLLASLVALAYMSDSRPRIYKLAQDPSHLISELEFAFANADFPPAAYHLVHFSDPQCRCDADAQLHLAQLQQQFPELQIWYQADSSRINASDWPGFDQVPAAALYDADGQLAYFGPYSSGPTCGSGFNFVEQMLEQMSAKDSSPVPSAWINELALGCFCFKQI